MGPTPGDPACTMRRTLLLIALLIAGGEDDFYAGDVAWVEEWEGLDADWTAYGYPDTREEDEEYADEDDAGALLP